MGTPLLDKDPFAEVTRDTETWLTPDPDEIVLTLPQVEKALEDAKAAS